MTLSRQCFSTAAVKEVFPAFFLSFKNRNSIIGLEEKKYAVANFITFTDVIHLKLF